MQPGLIYGRMGDIEKRRDRKDEKSKRKKDMSEEYTLKTIARIHNDFHSKFGIPRQSVRVPEVESVIVFEPAYRTADAVRGLEEFDYIWLIWQFSQAVREGWSATVRPPRLGGNVRKGVFATRAPFRPNALGLSCVRLKEIWLDEKLGPVLYVEGADLMDGTPIYDIKPYLPDTECHPQAAGGFADSVKEHWLQVIFPEALLEKIALGKREALLGVLREDPRPGYQDDPGRVYGMEYGEYDIHFRVEGETLTVCDVTPAQKD